MKISILTPTIRPKGIIHLQKSLEDQTFNSFEWLVEVGLPKRGCDLSASFNRMLKRARGERIVIIQDYISINFNLLEEIDKLDNDKFYTFPVGKLYERTVTWDWRKEGEYRETKPEEWEADFASVPRKAFYDVGGFDEEFDKGWSWENVNLAQRANVAGYKFFVEPSISAVALDHDKIIPHPFRGKNENSTLAVIKKSQIDSGDWKLDYLPVDYEK